MDFKSMSDHELLLIINLKSEKKYTHDQLQDARQVYIERMYSRTVSAMNTSSALDTQDNEPVQEKTVYTSPSFDFSDTAAEPDSPAEAENPLPRQAAKAPLTAFDLMEAEEAEKEPSYANTATLTAVAPQEDSPGSLQIVMTELNENPTEAQQSEQISDAPQDENPQPQSYTPPAEPQHSAVSVRRENPFVLFLRGIFTYFLMPVIMVKEMCVFASGMVLLVTSFKSTLYHICTVTDFLYMILILFVWYFALNRRAAALCKILIFTEIFRTASELMMMQSFFGNTISIIYISLLLLTSFSIRKSR